MGVVVFDSDYRGRPRYKKIKQITATGNILYRPQ